MAHQVPSVFQVVTLRIPVSCRDELATVLWELDTCGFEERELASGLLVEAWFEERADSDWLSRELGQRFPGCELTLHTASFRPDQWLEDYARTFTGFAIDDEFYVYPPWEQPSPAHPVNLLIEPGHGFGTGSHESTQLALRGLRPHTRDAATFLDVGTGSGILAVGALKLQPDLKAVTLDIDPLAVSAAAENLARNRVKAALVVGEPGCLAGGFDLVVANLTAPLLRDLASELARMTRRWLVISGFTEDEIHWVVAAWSGLGLELDTALRLNGWCAQVWKR